MSEARWSRQRDTVTSKVDENHLEVSDVSYMPEVYKLPMVRMRGDIPADETSNVQVYIGTK